MKIKRLLSLLMSIIMVCFLVGCENSGQAPLSGAVEPDTPTAEPTVTPTAEPADNERALPFAFADVSNIEFWFGSGVGSWRTVLYVHEDGTFEGKYSDADMDVMYLCDFTGKLTQPEKVNEYTYSAKVEAIELAQEPDTKKVEGDKTYIYSTPYGLDDAEEILFYLPGAPLQELPEEYLSWARSYGDSIGTELPFYGLYNVNAQQGFSSHKKFTIYDELAYLEQEEAFLESRPQIEGLSQAELTERSQEIYQMWDSKLNDIWSRLKEQMDAEAMETLTVEELAWIAYKETEIKKAGLDVEGGTLQPMVEYGTGAELTKARVYVLAEYLVES